MLVVHPASTCDVCLESYSARPQNIPCSISCGHVFCLNCLKSLRQQICPLCRSPFEVTELRRLHVDRSDSQFPAGHGTSSPMAKRSALPPDNALGLVDDIPRATRLQQKISDLVLRGSFSTGVRERGVREFIQEIHAFLSTEPRDMHADLRAEFLLLYRFTELQAKFHQLETTAFDLRTENSRNRQAIADWEQKYQDLQRSRVRDQESARLVESSLRERLRIEELEWQRKYDYVSEQCVKLRDELDRLRFSTPVINSASKGPRRSTSASQLLHLAAEDRSPLAHNTRKTNDSTKEDVDIFSNYNPDLFHLSPVPPTITLSKSAESDDGEDYAIQKNRHKAPESPSRTSSTSSNISRASESAAALKPYYSAAPIRATANRQRSGSYPDGGPERTQIYRFESRTEVSSSMPCSYMYRSASPTRGLFPTTPPRPQDRQVSDDAAVSRLYSLLEKPAHVSDSRLTSNSDSMSKTSSLSLEQQTSRPPLPRSNSYQRPRSSEHSSAPGASSAQNTPASRRVHPPMHVQTSFAPASQYQRNMSSSSLTPTPNQSEPQTAEALSPIQRTPPRPVLPHMHSYFTLYSPPPAKPASPKENHVGVRGTLPRRGSLSSASAAALAPTSSPGVVAPSSLGPRRSRGQGLFGNQDSDA